MRILAILVVMVWHRGNLDVVSGAPSDTPSANFGDSVRTFATNSFTAIAEHNSGNLIYSPLGASMVLTMAAYGASGNTAKQMRTVLGIPVNNPQYLIGVTSTINKTNLAEDYELRLANKIYVPNNNTIKLSFKSLTREKFLAQAETVDFGDPRGASRIINSWTAEKTSGVIKDIVSPDSIGSDTGLVLVNAAYFKGNWFLPFNPELTKERDFYVNGTTVQRVPTMFRSDSYWYGELDELDATFVRLIYNFVEYDNSMNMYIILPNKRNGLPELLKNFNKNSLEKLTTEYYQGTVRVYLPRFEIESKIDLRQSLEKMGMTDMFTMGANFGGIDAEQQLVVSEVTQKAFIKVNEKGTEAAAATGFNLVNLSGSDDPIDFVVDHPFMAIIMNEEKMPIFMAAVNNPAGLDSAGESVEKPQATNRNSNPTPEPINSDWVWPDQFLTRFGQINDTL